jgi:6,7-dimethyl-8-ribityllumazine synthase
MTRPGDQTELNANDAEGLRIALVVSTYHAEITSSMCRAAEQAFHHAGGRPEDLVVVAAPGTFELIAICRALAEREDIDAIVALGCVIRGETRHDRVILGAVAQSLGAIIVESGIPIAFGVLTCENYEQATARAGGSKGNKGEEAMRAAIVTALAVDAIAQEEELA